MSGIGDNLKNLVGGEIAAFGDAKTVCSELVGMKRKKTPVIISLLFIAIPTFILYITINTGIKDMTSLAIVAGCLVVIAFIIGLSIHSYLRGKQIEALKSTGKKLTGRLTGVFCLGQTDSSSVNGIPVGRPRLSYRLIASVETEDHKLVEYQGRDIFYGPFGLRMANYQAMPINLTVYVDPNNDKNFYIDPTTTTTADSSTPVE